MITCLDAGLCCEEGECGLDASMHAECTLAFITSELMRNWDPKRRPEAAHLCNRV